MMKITDHVNEGSSRDNFCSIDDVLSEIWKKLRIHLDENHRSSIRFHRARKSWTADAHWEMPGCERVWDVISYVAACMPVD